MRRTPTSLHCADLYRDARRRGLQALDCLTAANKVADQGDHATAERLRSEAAHHQRLADQYLAQAREAEEAEALKVNAGPSNSS